ncbi:MAG: phosphatidate cytidylyltransferase [Bacteroidales bacterium]|nr:phosphatidate cytidylyltransferase [Bacteroidales bacterium]
MSCLLLPSRDGFNDITFLYTGLLYIALPITLSPIVVMDGEVFDGWMLLSFFIIIWLSDVGAYCFGTAFGQKPESRKLAPSISPKKSWWGFWSGLVFGIGTAVGLHYLGWLPYGLGHCIALGAIVSAGGVCGDLFESMWKRQFGVKDSGRCIPGHGGMLDRFDSSLVAIPMAYVYLALIDLL